jgi:hypothetical protein
MFFLILWACFAHIFPYSLPMFCSCFALCFAHVLLMFCLILWACFAHVLPYSLPMFCSCFSLFFAYVLPPNEGWESPFVLGLQT